MPKPFRVRQTAENDVPAVMNHIADWLKWDVPREDSIRRAISREELLVAEKLGRVVGFIHFVIHEDIIDGRLNSFITALYVASGFRGMGIGSSLLHAAIRGALDKGAVGIEVSTVEPGARRFYEAHHFKQFMSDSAMGEVFLELDVKEYRKEVCKRT